MNIFYLDPDPVKCAEYHCDSHAVKMIVEYCQLLSTAHHLTGSKLENLCKPTHANHPSAIWVREGVENYKWLHSLLESLCKEYTHRYGRIHAYESNGRVEALGTVPNLPEGGTVLRMALPDQYKILGPVQAYRAFYCKEKFEKGLLVWTNRGVPKFLPLFGLK